MKKMNRLKTRRWRDGENRLSVFAMQFYYMDTANATNPDKHLFDSTGVSGGLHFDRNDVAATLAEAKGYTRYFVNYLATLPPAERLFITQQLPDLRDWYIQAGSDALNATAGTQRAFLLGGTGGDNLTGGGQAGNDTVWGEAAPTGGDPLANGESDNDILIGTAAQDLLTGGDGNDQLWRLRDARKTRRWRDGEERLRAANEATWRRSA